MPIGGQIDRNCLLEQGGKGPRRGVANPLAGRGDQSLPFAVTPASNRKTAFLYWSMG
jgi:hypothetical protein